MIRLSPSDRVLMAFIYAALALLAFTTFYPFWNAAVISFNKGSDTMLGGVTFWPALSRGRIMKSSSTTNGS